MCACVFSTFQSVSSNPHTPLLSASLNSHIFARLPRVVLELGFGHDHENSKLKRNVGTFNCFLVNFDIGKQPNLQQNILFQPFDRLIKLFILEQTFSFLHNAFFANINTSGIC